MNKPNKAIAAQDPGCDFDPSSISVAEATSRILAAVKPISQVESVNLRAALGRVLAENVESRVQVPNHTNSAMDGYAFSGADVNDRGIRTLTVVGTSFAGKPFRGTVASGQCIRIMTGGVMPAGTDTVEMQERMTVEGEQATLTTDIKIGANVRRAGEDLEVGDVAIPAGTRVGPVHLGLAASLGFAELRVYRRPRVAFFSNGDELRSVGEPLGLGEVYDSNRYTLFGMLEDAGAEMVDLGVVRDDPDAIRKVFADAASCADMVITSAGASVGDADYVQDTLQSLGAVTFWKVAVKPGRPLSFGNLGDAMFFGLPGNPVSVLVTFDVFVRPALRRLSGEEQGQVAIRMRVPAAENLKKRPGRMEYQRGILSQDEDGRTVVRSTGDQGSGILHSMSVANCYIILPDMSEGVAAGELVDVQPFASTV